jgi:hypothetical protein
MIEADLSQSSVCRARNSSVKRILENNREKKKDLVATGLRAGRLYLAPAGTPVPTRTAGSPILRELSLRAERSNLPKLWGLPRPDGLAMTLLGHL